MAGIDSDGDKNFTFGIMNKTCWLVMGLMIATSAVAQVNTNTPPATVSAPIILPPVSAPPAPATNAPVKARKKLVKHKKLAALAEPKKIAVNEPVITLVPGPAEVAADNVNVRGQAGLKGEFITHLSKGAAVTVISQLNLDKHQIDEPAQWAKIAFPTNAHIWVNSQFIDATNKIVKVKKLNLRAGPSENYSVLGVIERGAPINILTTRGEWIEIEAPSTAYAFIAAMYLKQEASGNLAVNPGPSTETQPVPAPTPTVVPEPQAIVTEPTNPPAAPETAAVTPTPVPAPTPAPPIETNSASLVDTNDTSLVSTNPPPPRIVTHEGVVRHVISVIEPTDYEIFDPKNGTDINYLYTTTTNLDFGRYKGLRIVVTGEESMSARWPNTPVMTVQRIQVVK
jgi:uncharacterized protein YgiM (DUF1202 family)